MYIIFGNYGNNTIALIQWTFLRQLTPVTVINVDTGWGATAWRERVALGQELAKRYGFHAVTLKPTVNFEDLILDRKSFPTQKYQWCPTFLKALPFLAWLDEQDPSLESTILLGSRRQDSRSQINLPEYIDESEHYGGRKVWYPLYNLENDERNELIKAAGFEILQHRSLECAPCIHSLPSELKYLDEKELNRVTALENQMNETWFQSHYPGRSIQSLYLDAHEQSPSQPDMGCGTFYACGE